MRTAVESLWITCRVIPKIAVDKGVVIPRENMQYKMNILICRKIKGFSVRFRGKRKKRHYILG